MRRFSCMDAGNAQNAARRLGVPDARDCARFESRTAKTPVRRCGRSVSARKRCRASEPPSWERGRYVALAKRNAGGWRLRRSEKLRHGPGCRSLAVKHRIGNAETMGSIPIGSSRKPLESNGFFRIPVFRGVAEKCPETRHLDTFGTQKCTQFRPKQPPERRTGRRSRSADSKYPSRQCRSSGLRVWPDRAKTVTGATPFSTAR